MPLLPRPLRRWIPGLVLAASPLAAAERPVPPSFLLILSDDQSWVGTSLPMIPGRPDTASDHFRTPNLERLAAQGMRFTDGYSPAPYCCPTRRSSRSQRSNYCYRRATACCGCSWGGEWRLWWPCRCAS